MSAGKRVLYVDAYAGASGDMMLGALIDLGVPMAGLRRALESLPIEGWTLRSRKVIRAGLAARKVDVRVRAEKHGRGWRALKRIVAAGALEPAVRRRVLAIFRRLIEAEAEAHGMAPDKVHLHEAGGTDAIIDVVGACVGLEHLGVSRIVVSPMTTGFGTVRCDHGVYPVPGPATLNLVRGCPVRAGDVEVERLTPTGAAVLTSIADEWGPMPALRPLAVGYGAGERDIDSSANVLRLVLGESEARSAPADGQAGEVAVIECTLDDSTPQALAYASRRLLDAGALEVFGTAVTMKKGRPGHHLTVLARPAEMAEVIDLVLRETSTLGLRYRVERRVELERSSVTVKTEYGSVRVKVGELSGEIVQAWPEYEDCAELARRRKVPLGEVQQAALQAYRSGKRAATKRRSRS